jgi:hypothetical protein
MRQLYNWLVGLVVVYTLLPPTTFVTKLLILTRLTRSLRRLINKDLALVRM